MSEAQTIYENAVTTHRTAEWVARRHGFESVAVLAESLPPEANVMDVGAGDSRLGHEVATLRPDIRWTNFDYSYKNRVAVEKLQRDAPANLRFIAGDATKLADMYEPESFDTIFSYWLLPHLSLDNPGPAKVAAMSMYGLLKPGGFMSTGPAGKRLWLPRIRQRTVHITKHEGQDPTEIADLIVAQTTLHPRARTRLRLQNQVVTPLLGTTRYTQGQGRKMKIFHPSSGEYVPVTSRRGTRVIGGLAVAMTKQYAKERRTKS